MSSLALSPGPMFTYGKQGAANCVCLGCREQFVIPQATEQYQELIKLLPAEFVGSPARLVPLAQLLCAEMGAAFAARALTCPPWRQAKSLLSKWLPAKARIPTSAAAFIQRALRPTVHAHMVLYDAHVYSVSLCLGLCSGTLLWLWFVSDRRYGVPKAMQCISRQPASINH